MTDELDDKKVSAAHAAQREQPPAALDAAILAASRKAVGAGPRAQRPLRRWVPAFAVAATAVLGLALSLQMLVTPRPDPVLQERAKHAVETVSTAVPLSPLAPAPAPVPAAPPERANAMQDMAASPAPAAPMAAGGAAGAFEPAPQAAARQQAETEAMAARAREELKAEARESLERVEVTGSRIKRTDDAQMSAAPALAVPAAPAAAPRTLEDLRAELAQLRAAGKTEAADALQRELCAAYPDAKECED